MPAHSERRKNMKKVVLIVPPPAIPETDSEPLRHRVYLTSPLGVVALGSYLSAHDVPVEIVDVQMDYGIGLNPDAERAILRRVTLDLAAQADAIGWVGISKTWGRDRGLEIAREVHRALPQAPIILGGYQASGVYRHLLERHRFVTAVVRGDGEEAALRISRCVAQGKPFLCKETPNLAWREGGRIATSRMEAVDLARLPICDYRLLRNLDSYRMISVSTSRGCPFRCPYCAEVGMRPYAAFSIGWVQRQLSHVSAVTRCRWVHLVDAVFGVEGRERTLEVCKALRKLHFAGVTQTRTDVVGPEMVRTLANYGFKILFYGVESASPASLVRMGKVATPSAARRYVQESMRTIQACFEEGVTPVVGMMFAYPGDTESDYRASLEFVKELRKRHDSTSPRGGKRAGLFMIPFMTLVFDGTPLAEASRRKGVRLGGDPCWPVRCWDETDVALLYDNDCRNQSVITPLAADRLRRYGADPTFLHEKGLVRQKDDGIAYLPRLLKHESPRPTRSDRLAEPRGGLDRRSRTAAPQDAARLIEALGSPSARTRRYAASHLRGLQPLPPSAAPALSKALANDDPQVRRDAAQALAALGPAACPVAAELAKALGKEPDGQARQNLVLAFTRMTPPPAVAAGVLIGALEDDDLQVRKDAAWALSMMNPTPTAATPRLLKALDVQDPQLIWAATLALGKLAEFPSAVVKALARLSTHPDPRISKEAGTALRRLEERGMVNPRAGRGRAAGA